MAINKKKAKQIASQFAKDTGIQTVTSGVSFFVTRGISKWLGKKINDTYGESLVGWGMFGLQGVLAWFIPNKAIKGGLVSGSGVSAIMSTGGAMYRNSDNETVKSFFLSGEDVYSLGADDVAKAIEDRAREIAENEIRAKLNALSSAGLLIDPTKQLSETVQGDEDTNQNEVTPETVRPEEETFEPEEVNGEFDLAGEEELDGEYDLAGLM
ncbi:MAG: hypothetical protein KDK54_19675 [Leptospiraceae bacterium]|nr:hypothetical protein [Leptospiraceae bacterium]